MRNNSVPGQFDRRTFCKLRKHLSNLRHNHPPLARIADGHGRRFRLTLLVESSDHLSGQPLKVSAHGAPGHKVADLCPYLIQT